MSRQKRDEEAKGKVAFLGNPNDPDDLSTFGAIAARNLFSEPRADGAKWNFKPMADHQGVSRALWNCDVEFGVVAIESGIDGVVYECAREVEKLAARGIHVLEELILPVRFYLAASNPICMDQPLTILAHPKAAGQCLKIREFLKDKFGDSNVNLVPQKSNGAAANEILNKNEKNQVALVNWEGIKSKGLKVVDVDNDFALLDVGSVVPNRRQQLQVSDYERASTRFWKLGYGQFSNPVSRKTDKLGRKIQYNRTSILLSLDHGSPGGLSHALTCFSDQQCNLSIVFPIPIPGRQFEYSFLMEFEDRLSPDGTIITSGHIDGRDGRLNAAYETLASSGLTLNQPTILGAYGTRVVGSEDDKSRNS